MKIENLTITASACRSYNKIDVSITVNNIDSFADDYNKLQTLVIDKAIQGVNTLCSKMGIETQSQPNIEVMTEPKIDNLPVYESVNTEVRKQYPNNNNYRNNKPYIPYRSTDANPNGQYAPKVASSSHPASAKQKQMLQNLGYNGDFSTLTSEEAFKMISDLRDRNRDVM